MFNTIDECRVAWETAGGHGDISARIRRNARWIAYYKYIARTQKGQPAVIESYAAEVVQYLRDNDWLEPGASVLDVGAGTGTYALSFARFGGAVTALDMDAASLDVLQMRAAQLDLFSINYVHGMWEQYQTDSKFALAFSAMCPAICTYDDLLKLESMATKACCLISVSRGSYDLHRKNLMGLFAVKPQGGMTTETVWYYNMLYLMGRQPDVKHWTQHYSYDMTIAEACRRNEVYFRIFGIPKTQSRPILLRYFEEQAKNGLVHDESHLNTAIICWRPSEAQFGQ